MYTNKLNLIASGEKNLKMTYLGQNMFYVLYIITVIMFFILLIIIIGIWER